MFEQGSSLADVTETVGRSPQTVVSYLTEYIQKQRPTDVSAWIDDEMYQRVVDATKTSTDERLRPIFDALDGEVPYEYIHIVVAHQRAMAEDVNVS